MSDIEGLFLSIVVGGIISWIVITGYRADKKLEKMTFKYKNNQKKKEQGK